jgi:hypothetical protein
VENICVAVLEDSACGRNGLGFADADKDVPSVGIATSTGAPPEIFTGAPERVQAIPKQITTIITQYFLFSALCAGFIGINVACSPSEY